MPKSLFLRTCREDLTSYNGFKWPETGIVKAPDWAPIAVCGNGLHAWSSTQKYFSSGYVGCKNFNWQVLEIEEDSIIELHEDSIKFPECNVLFTIKDSIASLDIIKQRFPDLKINNYFFSLKNNIDLLCYDGFYSSLIAGNLNKNHLWGYRSNSILLGQSNTSIVDGPHSFSLTFGENGNSIANGRDSLAIAIGENSNAHTHKYETTVISIGNHSMSSSIDSFSPAFAEGEHCKVSTSGACSPALSLGFKNSSEAKGTNSPALSFGILSLAHSKLYHSISLGEYGQASNESDGLSLAGLNGFAKSGEKGIVAILDYDYLSDSHRLVVGHVGENGVEANTWYAVESGKLVKKDPQETIEEMSEILPD